jgi:putative glycosyltransferase
MKLSIVTTLYQSAEYIPEFHRRMSAEAARLTDDYEIVMVNDGSPDASLDVALGLTRLDPHVRVVELSRRFGHHKAIMTGLDFAQGEFIFLIDVDLEEDPAWLGAFWRTLREHGLDVVYGYQARRKGSVVERVGGAIHWWLIRHLSSYPIPENLCTARLMTRQYVASLLTHREQRTAIGGLWAMTGFRQRGVPVDKGHRERTSYSFSRRIAMAVDGITAFSEKPLELVFALGVLISAVSLVGIFILFYRAATGPLLSGWASLIISVWVLGGLTIACIGILGLYIARIFIETKGRPYTIVRAVHQHSAVPHVHEHA